MKAAPRVALYARVSTLAGQDPEMPLRELREYCQRWGLQIAQEYVDEGVSGPRERRPALDRLLVCLPEAAGRCRRGLPL